MYLDGTAQVIVLSTFVLASLFLHIKFYVNDTKTFFKFYLFFLTIGLFADGLLLLFKYYTFTGKGVGIFPLWLLALWFVFPLNFLHTFQKFLEKPWLCFLFGAIGGPLAYKAGPAFGILGLSEKTLFYVGWYWALYMVAASYFKDRTGAKKLA